MNSKQAVALIAILAVAIGFYFLVIKPMMDKKQTGFIGPIMPPWWNNMGTSNSSQTDYGFVGPPLPPGYNDTPPYDDNNGLWV